MTHEQTRLQQYEGEKSKWKKWGPYVTDRQWGTVREDYSANGQPWEYLTHDQARSKAYRWGEDGIAGICDSKQLLCFAVALWNKKDPIIKERLFGLAGNEGNHGEDVKELYYYLDSTPTHSYMKMLYKYPQSAYPYAWIVEENHRRDRLQPEFELTDTGIFNEDKYFDVFVEYAKAAEEDILIKITVHNMGNEDAALNVLPQLWFRNTWSWGYDEYEPLIKPSDEGNLLTSHRQLGQLTLHLENKAPLLFCNNDSNLKKLYDVENEKSFVKDGINEFLTNGNTEAASADVPGTKAAVNYDVSIKAKESVIIRLRLSAPNDEPFKDFDTVFAERLKEADEFYHPFRVI